MIHDHEHICPRCGAVLPSSETPREHWERRHSVPASPGEETEATYASGCPILDFSSTRRA